MAANSQESGAQERDMSRAQWMRTTGQVVMSQAADHIFADEELPGLDDHQIDDILHDRQYTRPRAANLAQDILSVVIGRRAREYATTMAAGLPSEIQAEFAQHTFAGSARQAVEEGSRGQIAFPLNLSNVVSRKTDYEYQATDLISLAAFMRRPDTAAVTAQAAFAKNGSWEQVTNLVSAQSNEAWLKLYDGIDITDGTISMGQALIDELRQSMRQVNRLGDSSKDSPTAVRTSSGCPISHPRPCFSEKPQDQARLTLLADVYETTPEALMFPREIPVTTLALGRMATILEHYDPLVADIWAPEPAATSTDSARYQALADRLSAVPA